MSKEVFFEGDAEVLPFTTPTTPTATLQKPSDVLDVPAAAPSTIWYLSITKPHVDSHDIIGPTKAFRHLLPRIEAIVSNSATAIDKLAQLKETEDMWGETEPNEHFFNNGFEEKTRPVALNFLHAFGKSDAPIVAPSRVPWGQKAFTAYLGEDPEAWRACTSGGPTINS